MKIFILIILIMLIVEIIGTFIRWILQKQIDRQFERLCEGEGNKWEKLDT